MPRSGFEPRWETGDEAGRSGYEVVVGWRRLNAYRRPRRATATSADGEPLYEFTLKVPIGGFGVVGVHWLGTTWEDARDGFLEWLVADDEFADGIRHTHHRSLYVKFNGRRMLLTFRTDWIAAFAIY